jgi:hypothetical protein
MENEANESDDGPWPSEICRNFNCTPQGRISIERVMKSVERESQARPH